MTVQEAWQQALTFIGNPVEVEDPTALDQCMDWAFKWCDLLGIDRATIRHPYAFQVYIQPQDITLQYFELIPNTPNGIPHLGDLVVFDKNIPGVTGTAGHICVATGEGDNNSFKSLDQNWNGVQHVTQETHTYTGVLGWLRLRVSSAELDQCRMDRDKNWNLYQADEATITNLNQQINDRNNNITQLNAQIATLNTQLTASQDQVNTLQPIAATVPQLQKQLAQSESDRQKALEDNASLLRSIAQLKAGKPQGFWNKLKYVFT